LLDNRFGQLLRCQDPIAQEHLAQSRGSSSRPELRLLLKMHPLYRRRRAGLETPGEDVVVSGFAAAPC
jgi:hypothetical protein